MDTETFNTLMEKQRSLSVFNRGDESGYREALGKALETKRWETKFLGYDALDGSGRTLMLFSKQGQPLESLAAARKASLFLTNALLCRERRTSRR